MKFLIFVLVLIVLRNFWGNLWEDYLRPISKEFKKKFRERN